MRRHWKRLRGPLLFASFTLSFIIAAYELNRWIKPDGFWGYLGGECVAACASVLAIALALMFWGMAGGDPLFAAIRQIALITNDVLPNGVQRLWLERRIQKCDTHDSREEWVRRLEAAKCVELMGNSLSSSWLSKENAKDLAATLALNPSKTVHVIIYAPDSQFAIQRADSEHRDLLDDIRDTLKYSALYEQKYPDRWIRRSAKAHYLPLHYVRADDLMLVCFYSVLTDEGGNKAFSLQLRPGALFNKFQAQFNTLFVKLGSADEHAKV